MENLLSIKNLKKKYSNKEALRGLDLEIGEGKIVGLLGPNGSGKTTLLKVLAGLLKPDFGSVEIAGVPVGVKTKELVSFLPDREFLYKWMTVGDSLKFFKDFYKDFDYERSEKLLESMNLDRNLKVTNLSKGMMEKLNLTLIMSRNTKLYLLDEPLGGVDPTAREKIIDTIIENFREDSTVIISTHLVNSIERIFDEVSFISEGSIILKGDAEELRSSHSKSIDEIYREVFK